MSDLNNKILSYRRYFHKYPELGWTEYATAAYISEELEKLGFYVKKGKDVMVTDSLMGLPDFDINKDAWERALTVFNEEKLNAFKDHQTALAGIMDCGTGPTIVCRFDMDALPITEAISNDHLPFVKKFSSDYNGIMHSCGHDAHIAIGLGLANLIFENRANLKGKIILLFQPAEEGVRGADAIIQSGFLDDVDYILASHVWSNMPLGTIVCSQNGTAYTHKYDVEFMGKASHAGICPEKGNNALLAAANAVININGISRNSSGYSRLNVGKFESGTARNIIPDYAKIELEMRSENIEIEDYIQSRSIQILKSSAEMFNCKLNIIPVGEAKGAEGDKELASIIYDEAKDISFFNNIVFSDNVCRGSEDFTSMMNYVQSNNGKACFIGLGASIPKRELSHHSPNFDIDEKILGNSAVLYLKILERISK